VLSPMSSARRHLVQSGMQQLRRCREGGRVLLATKGWDLSPTISMNPRNLRASLSEYHEVLRPFFSFFVRK
jgi:hypothetical protein